jgi:hypothetical protein
MGSVTRRITVQASSGIKARHYAKITKVKRAGGVAQMMEHLLSKHKALSSTPVSQKKKKKRKEKVLD